MLRNRVYYVIKPLLPTSLRWGVRRWLCRRQRERIRDVWPIQPGSERPPKGWPGWPDGKRFAFVLTHDVEGQSGLDKCHALMDLEARLGFRSSFNLIPRGSYSDTLELRQELSNRGFEVGVHDLYHDGKLYQSRTTFRRNAALINSHLKDWGAVGFRSGFMLHNLNWLHDLDIEYDASTFDTDPFEPQPHGRHTIFPFWCSSHNSEDGVVSGDQGRGYVELPYTLPQDSTLYLLLSERHPDIWFQKLDWVARNGGMVLLDTHPDYMAMNGNGQKGSEYPVSFYKRLLEYVETRYPGQYWHALPREVAAYVRKTRSVPQPKPSRPPLRRNGVPRTKIWIDLDNTPHVPFFEPILNELNQRGFPVLVTARDAFQVCDLADKKGVPYLKIGRHHGKNRLLKVAGLGYRAMQLAPIVQHHRPVLGVSHGARSQLLLGNLLRIPTLLIEDYEFSQFPPMMRPTWVMAPTVIPDSALCRKTGHIHKYPGIKEDVYAWKLEPDVGILLELGIHESELVATVRPPATEAHYHNPESEKLFEAFMDRACKTPGVRIVLLPRNKKQGERLKADYPRWFKDNKSVIPHQALDGLNLIWHSDLVVSGGGTMNREAAALGVPVYSIFRGTIGAVDKHLQSEGRLILVESVKDADQKILLEKRPRKSLAEVTSTRTLQFVVDTIEKLAMRPK